MPRPGVVRVRDMSTMIINAPRRVDMLVLYLVMMLMTQRVEDVHDPSKTTSIIDNVLVGFGTPIFDKSRDFYEGTIEVVDATVESCTTLTVDVHVHDTSDFAP